MRRGTFSEHFLACPSINIFLSTMIFVPPATVRCVEDDSSSRCARYPRIFSERYETSTQVLCMRVHIGCVGVSAGYLQYTYILAKIASSRCGSREIFTGKYRRTSARISALPTRLVMCMNSAHYSLIRVDYSRRGFCKRHIEYYEMLLSSSLFVFPV